MAGLGLSIVLLAGCGSPSSSSPLPGWYVVAKGKSSQAGPAISARGSAKEPSAFAIRVDGKPDLETTLSYELVCGTGTLSDKTAVHLPVTLTMVVPGGHPASCTMVASATKPASGELALTIFARSTPPTA